MALAPAVTDIEQLKGHPAVARLVGWNPQAVQGVKFDRDEMTIYVERSVIREACALLRDDPNCPFNYLCDVTAWIGILRSRASKLFITCSRFRRKSECVLKSS